MLRAQFLCRFAKVFIFPVIAFVHAAFISACAEEPSPVHAGPLDVITISTNSLEESRLFYVEGLGLNMKGPIVLSDDVKEKQRALWQIPDDVDWDLYVLQRENVEWAAQIRLLVMKQEVSAFRADWAPTTRGPYTIGFPNTRQDDLDRHMRQLGFGSLNVMERSPFTTDDGRQYEILETIHTGPDFVAAVGVARGEGQPPIVPVDDKGMGGPGYSMMVVDDVDVMAEFMTSVMGYRLKSRRLWKSTGTKGAMNVPDGTEFQFAQLVPQEGDYGFLIFIDFENLDVREPANQPGLVTRGIGLYTFAVPDIDAVLERARGAGHKVVHGPIELISAQNTPHLIATLRAPNGVLFELRQDL